MDQGESLFCVEGSCNPVFLTLAKISPKCSPYVYVVDQGIAVDKLPLVVKRFCNAFPCLSGFEIKALWNKDEKILRLIAFSAVNMYNYRLRMPVDQLCSHPDYFCGHDRIHTCDMVCYHKCDYVHEYLPRQTQLTPAEDTPNKLATYWQQAQIHLPPKMDWRK